MSLESDAEGLHVATAGVVRTLELRRPARRNALTLEDRFELRDALLAADADPDVRVVVVTGTGDHFCAGGDVREFDRPRTREQAHEYATSTAQAVFTVLREMGTPTIARVRGAAAGAGMYLALGCDIVVADESAYFHPAHLDIAVVPDWGAVWLAPRLLGMARAKALLLSGRRLDAATAASWGLIVECVAPAELERVVDDYAERLAAVPEIPMALTRLGLDGSLDRSLPEFLAWEADAIASTMSRPEHRERVQRFLTPP